MARLVAVDLASLIQAAIAAHFDLVGTGAAARRNSCRRRRCSTTAGARPWQGARSRRPCVHGAEIPSMCRTRSLTVRAGREMIRVYALALLPTHGRAPAVVNIFVGDMSFVGRGPSCRRGRSAPRWPPDQARRDRRATRARHRIRPGRPAHAGLCGARHPRRSKFRSDGLYLRTREPVPGCEN